MGLVDAVIGMMRVKNEARWIERCVRSILPVCGSVLIMDDHSDDETREICSGIPGVTVFESPFSDLNEARDKNWLLDKARGSDWILCIDGDEMLAPGSIEAVNEATTRYADSYSFRIVYLWDREDQMRVDGVYGRFRRPSMFRPLNHCFLSTSAGGNFHCGNTPWRLQGNSEPLNASLLHFGYLHRADRARKFHWYNQMDPNNLNEDGYRHMVVGDVYPANSQFRHAGPLKLESLAA